MLEFRLPDVGEGMEEAEIMRWLVAAGESVERDQAVVEIQTDKALVEIPSPIAGRVERLEVEVGARVAVGALLFVIDDGAGAPSSPNGESGAEKVAAPVEARSAPAPTRSRVKAAPTVRRLANELGVDLGSVQGTGPGGRVLADDVRRADSVEVPAVLPPAARGSNLGVASVGVHPLRGLRRATAEVMQLSWSSIPHIHSFDEIDAGPLLAAREDLRSRLADPDASLSPVAFFVRATALALRRFPLVNASIDMDAGTFEVHDEVNIGVAVATPDGLVVPVVRAADKSSLVDLGKEIRRLVEAGRNRRLRPEELRGGTFTVSNYGSLGGRFAAPVIRPPEAAILGFGAVRERPFVIDGEVRARPTLPVCFAADHRLIDGDLSQAFQEEVKELLSKPVLLVAGA